MSTRKINFNTVNLDLLIVKRPGHYNHGVRCDLMMEYESKTNTMYYWYERNTKSEFLLGDMWEEEMSEKDARQWFKTYSKCKTIKIEIKERNTICI